MAAWVVDGISYVTTEKSIADHAVSEAAQQDCATWRVLKGESVCLDDDLAPVAVAEGGAEQDSGDAPRLERAQAATDRDAEIVAAKLSAFETAVGGPPIVNREPTVSAAKVVIHAEPVDIDEMAALAPPARRAGIPESVTPESVTDIQTAFTVPQRKPERQVEAPIPERPVADEGGGLPETAVPGLYFVIGSYVDLAQAQAARSRHHQLRSSIVFAELDGRGVYRVAVGPFAKPDLRSIRRRITRAGIYDAWAIRLDESDWVVAEGPGDIAELP